MATIYPPLATTLLDQGASFHQPPQQLPDRVSLDMPAIYAMTDFERVTAITIEASASIQKANQKMITNQIRLLLVTNTKNQIEGILTVTDLLGEKPMLVSQKTGRHPDELSVQDLMTSSGQLEVMQMVDVDTARIGNIVESLKRQGRQHALVVDIDETNMKESVRGLFSTTQLSKQLGFNLETNGKANTFAELEQALLA